MDVNNGTGVMKFSALKPPPDPLCRKRHLPLIKGENAKLIYEIYFIEEIGTLKMMLKRR